MANIVFTSLGIAYIVLDVVWTAFLVAGLWFLYRHRRLPFLQIRRLPLVFAAIICLHVYGFVCTLGITVGQVVPCDAQFWIMSIYLPFGMALLQAANSQFLFIASRQKKYATFNNLDDLSISDKALPIDPSLPWWKKQGAKMRRLDKVDRILVYIGIGMIIEVRSEFAKACESAVTQCVSGRAHVLGLLWQRDLPCRLRIVQCQGPGNRTAACRSMFPGLGVVAVNCLAILLGLVLRPLHTLEDPQHRGYPWLANSDRLLLYRWTPCHPSLACWPILSCVRSSECRFHPAPVVSRTSLKTILSPFCG